MCTKRANEKVLFIQTSQVVHSGSQAQPLSWKPSVPWGMEVLVFIHPGLRAALSGPQKARRDLRLSPGPPVSSEGVTAVSLLRVSDLTQTLGSAWALLHTP